MKDAFGTELKIGDKVAYIDKLSRKYYLSSGVINKLNKEIASINQIARNGDICDGIVRREYNKIVKLG